MPLLMCPNCDASMQAVQRASVEFDMCPRCRGVWLDRGELEKLISIVMNNYVQILVRAEAARAALQTKGTQT